MLKKTLRDFGIATLLVSFFASSPAHALGNLHPSFTVKDILPAELDNIGGIGGIDLLPNGDGAICTWGGSQKSQGEVWIIPNLASGTPGTPVRIANGLREPLGLKTVGNDFYVMEKSRIDKFTGSGVTWTRTTLWSLPTAWYDDGQWHHFSFNLIAKDNYLWFTTGTAYDYTANDPIQRGALIRVNMDGSGFTQMARGLRNTNGIGIGPNNEIFCTDNQGHFKPVDYLYHIPTKGTLPTNGRFYGFRTNANNSCGVTPTNIANDNCPKDYEYPPAIYIPYGNISNSPTRPILLSDGPYKGQMISGDVFHGGTLRYFLEKVGGEYQGAVFPMMTSGSGGINFGINQFLYTPTGNLLVAGIGGGTCGLGGSGNWAWNSTCRGLDLLTPTTTTPFEILAIRSLKDGFEVEFTKPAAASAATAANYQVKSTIVTPVKEYGIDSSSSDNNVTVGVTSVSLSSDGLRATLKMASMLTHRYYAITVNNVKSTTGDSPYNNVGYYTLNTADAAEQLPDALRNGRDGSKPVSAIVMAGKSFITLPFILPYQLGLSDLRGRKIATISGKAPQTWEAGNLKSGIYLLSGTVDGAAFGEKVTIP